MTWLELLVLALLIFIVYTLIDNEIPRLKVTNIQIDKNKNPRLINKDQGQGKKYTIYQITDLHNYGFGKRQERIMSLIKDKPDFIFITGDLIDRFNLDNTNAYILLEELDKKYKGKIYFITGNHEKGSAKYKELEEKLRQLGIKQLKNEKIDFEDFRLVGLDDPSDYKSSRKIVKKDMAKEVDQALVDLVDKDRINICLSHRPEFMPIYVKYGLSLVFSGHTHGGQARLFGRGLFSTSQGFLPKYAGGIFKEEKTLMVNSTGLGNNLKIMKRVFNSPQVNKIKLFIFE